MNRFEKPPNESNQTRRKVPAGWRYVVPPWWLVPYYALLLGALLSFAELAQGVYADQGLRFDTTFLTWLAEHQSRPLTGLALVLNYLAISYTLGAITVAVAIRLWRKNRRSAIFLLVSFWGAIGVNLIAKALFARARPGLFEQLTPITNSSFPSGHAMGSFALALASLIVLVRLRVRNYLFRGTAALMAALLVGLSRTYLQVHYPSDVLAGWALSAAWVLGVGAWYTYGFRERWSPGLDAR